MVLFKKTMIVQICLLSLAFYCFCCESLFAQETSKDSLVLFSEESKMFSYNPPSIGEMDSFSGLPMEETRNYCALLIAVNNYEFDSHIRSLISPIRDAKSLKFILTRRYTFEEENVWLLENPGRSQILDRLRALRDSLHANDNLLIFYAGHGYWDKYEKKGYWLPKDASSDKSETWVSNLEILNCIDSLDTRNTILITDACFSGSIFKESLKRSMTEAYAIDVLYKKKSRIAMTSGTYLDEVPDQSRFTERLFSVLSENKSPYISAWDLFSAMHYRIIRETNIVPQYGALNLDSHEGGDFIFFRKGA